MPTKHLSLPVRPMRFALLLAAAVLLSACTSGPQVRTSGAEQIDFGAFRTFGFFDNPSTNRAGYHSLITQQLMASTRREMEVRGLEFVTDPAQAELLINFYVDVGTELRVRNTGPMWTGPTYWDHRRGFYDPWRGHRGWPAASGVDIQQITRGTLNVDVVEASRNMLIWEGMASQRLTQRTLNDLGPAMDDAVHHIFREFPVVPRM
jgi:hypothetical protein